MDGWERWRKIKEVDDDVDINADADAEADANVNADANADADADADVDADDDDDDLCSIFQARAKPRRSAGRLTRLRANITYGIVNARLALA